MSSDLVPVVAPPRRCALYRHFDDNDVLLYVGISESPVDRTNGHARVSEWVQYAARAEVEWHNSRDLAAAAEREAIVVETPVFNRQYATGDVDARIAEYVRQWELQELRDDLAMYEMAVRAFMDAMPEALVREAEAWAYHDCQCAGEPPGRTFPVHVLRHLGRLVNRHANVVEDRGRAEVYLAVHDWLQERLADLAVRDNERQDSRSRIPPHPSDYPF